MNKLRSGVKVRVKSGRWKGREGYIDHQAVDMIYDPSSRRGWRPKPIRGLWFVNLLRPELRGGYASYVFRTRELALAEDDALSQDSAKTAS